MKFKNYFLNLFLILVFFVLNYTFLPGLFNSFNLWPFLVSFLLMFFNEKLTLTLLFLGGFLMDLFSVYFFGFHIIVFLIIYFVLKYLIRNIVTTRSLNSVVILVVAASVIFTGIELIFNFIARLAKTDFFYVFSLKFFLIAMGINVLFSIFIFLTLKFFSRRLRADII